MRKLRRRDVAMHSSNKRDNMCEENQIQQIEKLVSEDSTNGRHLSKRLKQKLIKKGYCIETVKKQLENLKLAF